MLWLYVFTAFGGCDACCIFVRAKLSDYCRLDLFVLKLYAYNCVLYSCAVFINDSIRVETDNYFVILKYPGVSSSESTIYSFAVLGVEFKFDNCEI